MSGWLSSDTPGSGPNRSLRRLSRSAPLIGREAELAAVLELLADPSVRLVSLTGRSGVGKTRLALEAALTLDAARPGSAQVVSLASIRDPELVLSEIASQLDIVAQPSRSIAAAVLDWLARDQLVLLLDNLEHLPEATETLVALHEACPRLQLLVTSQTPLRLAEERLIRLRPLPVDDAQRSAVLLYCDRARAADHRFRLTEANATAVTDLCRELEGLPLAIELAGARAVTLPPAEMLHRVRYQRLDLLRAPRADVPSRHGDLRSAIDWTFDLLAPDQRDLLIELSIADGRVDLDDLDVFGPNRLEQLSALVDCHLVEPHEVDGRSWFALSPSVRAFAAEQRPPAARAAAEERWLTWLAGRAGQAGVAVTSPDPDAWWSWLAGAQDGLRNALLRSLDGGRTDLALQLLRGLAPYWSTRGWPATLDRLFDRAIDPALRSGEPSSALAEALLWSALIGIRVPRAQRLPHYRERLRRGEQLARTLDDERLILLALHHRLLVTPMTGELDELPLVLAEGLDRARALGQPFWTTQIELSAARMALRTGDTAHAIEAALRALAEARRGGDTRAELDVAMLLQTMAPSSPAAAAAVPSPEVLIGMARATHQRLVESVLRPLLSVQALAGGDLNQAATWCEGALDIVDFGPASLPAGFALIATTAIAAARGDAAVAARLHGRLVDVQDGLFAAMPPAVVSRYRSMVSELEQTLGPDDFTAALGSGRSLDWTDARAEASRYLRAQPPATTESGNESGVERLTERQREVVVLLAQGLTNKDIAARLGLTPKTVMHHTVAVYQRLGVRGRSEAVAWAVRTGMVPDPH